MSVHTSTCASVSGPAPIPTVGMCSTRVTSAASSAGTSSSTTANAPRVLHGLGVAQQACCAASSPPPLHAVAHRVDGLRGQPDVGP